MEVKDLHISSEWKKPLVVGNRTFKAFYDFSLTNADLEKARERLGETEDVRNTCLRKLKEKMHNDKEMSFCADDQSLLRYLRYKKFNYEMAYIQLRNLCLFRKEHPELFAVPPNFEFLLKTKFMNWLPYTDEEGATVLVVDYRKWNIEEVSVSEYLQMHHGMADIITLNPKFQIHGAVELWDLRGITLKHVTNAILKPYMLSILPRLIQDLYPFKIKRVILLNSNKYLRSLYNNVICKFMKKKVRDTVVFLGSDLSELHQYVNPAILPKEYGGNLDDDKCCTFKPIIDNISYLKYERSFIAT